MRSNRRKKLFQAGIASFLLAVACLLASANSIAADQTFVTVGSTGSVGLFTILSYTFFAISVVFFFYTLLRKN